MGAFQDSLEGYFVSEQVDEDDLTEEILAIILLLFLLGAGYEDESQLTSDDEKKLEEAYQLTVSVVPGMVDRHSRGLDMQPTIERTITHVSGMYFYAFAVHGMDRTKLYVWTLGDTEHCVDCIAQAEKGEMPAEHWAEMAVAGIYPKSPALFCTGLHCGCEVDEA